MAIFRHQKLTASPDRLSIPGHTTLRCSIYSLEESTVDVTYSLERETKYWFEMPNGLLVKSFKDPDVAVTSDPTAIERKVKLAERLPGTNPSFFFVTAVIVEDGSGSRIQTSAAITPT